MGEPLILTRQDGPLHYVTLNRVDKRNALTIEMMEALAEAVREADQYPAVRAVIVHANGPVFSSGIDVMALATMRAGAGDMNAGRWLRRFAEQLQQTLHRIEQSEVPVIGALHGKVMGMGLELACAFDFRVGDPSVQLSLPETRLGLIADVGGITRLVKLVGPSRTKDLLLTARTMDAAEALHWGLLNRVSEAEASLAAAEALGHQIAQNAPLAVGLGKLVVDQGDGLDRYTHMFLERLAQSQLIATEDLGEGLSAFLEKRPAAWKGA
jgi:enoyl-CoA hydratase/carnithine racemase